MAGEEEERQRREAAALLSPALARRFGLAPVRVDAERLVVAAAAPPAPEVLDAVAALAERDVEVVAAPEADVAAAQAAAFGSRPAVRAGRYRPAAPPRSPHPAFLRRIAERADVELDPLDDPGAVDPDAARLLGERLSRRLGVLVLSASGGEARVATAHVDADALALVAAVTALEVRPVLAPADRLHAAIDRVFAGGPARTQPLGVPEVDVRALDPDRRLGELLVREGAIGRVLLGEALGLQRSTGDRLGHILVALGYLSGDRVAAAVARQLGVPHVAAGDLNPPARLARELPQKVCRVHGVLPLELLDDVLVVAMADPLDEAAVAALRASTPRRLRVVVASADAIAHAAERLYAAEYVEVSTTELLRRSPDESAHRVLSHRQKVVLAALAGALVLGVLAAPVPTLILLVAASTLFYLATSTYKFALIYRTVGHAPEIPVSDAETALLDERTLPRYTILAPLYREAVMTTQLVDALRRLDYPRTKLDVKLLLEEDDEETIASVRAAALGPQFDVVVVPDSHPKTKPKACNYGLLRARGDCVVIYDAEDIPEPDQLRKAVVAFRKAPPEVACIQAKLNYWNPDQNLLTRWFTTEYSMWFDLFLPGLDASGAPIPLGGTSNHFRLDTLLELGAWDPFNVTEDADVGIRLSRRGYRTATIDSTTYEEANSRVYNWVRQRSRWVKGYVQTWLVHMRHPVRLWRELGPGNFLSFQLVVGGTPLTMLLNPLFWGLTSLWAATEAGVIREVFPGIVYFAGAVNLFLGNFVFTYLNVAGCMRRGYHGLVKYALLSPLYWALMSVAAWKGLLQLITRPSYWEKTVHGLANGR